MKIENLEGMKEMINEFDKEHLTSDIVLLGFDGAVRRIKLDVEEGDD